MRERWFFVFFIVSGFCALLCQVVWLRLAMARFGVTAAMVAIVLSVFMAGLALGNALGGRLVSRGPASPRRALVLYAACELAIALSSQVVPRAFAAGRATIAGAAWASGAYYLASGMAVTAALLPFCVAMGATLPLALAAIGPRLRGGASSVGHLYAANVLGAAAGTLASAFVLIEVLGFRATLDLGASLNAFLAAGSLLLSLRAGGAASPAEGAAPAAANPDPATRAALFGTGFASMAMEVVWVRQFTPMLGNVVYAFALILASYLVATLAGSLLYRARSRALSGAGPAHLAWIAAGLLSLLPSAAADPRMGVPRADRSNVVDASGGGPAPAAKDSAAAQAPARRAGPGPWQRMPQAGAMAAVFLAVVPFSALLGFVTPWLVDRWSGGAPRAAGAAWAVNGLGCVLGPLAGGFLLLPWLGERGALLTLALLVLGLGLLRAPRPAAGATAVAGLAALAVTAATADEASRFPDAIVRRDSTATVIVRGQGMDRHLLVNGLDMTHLTPITKFMSHLPLSHLAQPPVRGLVICFGMGTSFRSMRSWGIDTTAVELVPSVPAFFSAFHPDAAPLLSDPRGHVVVDDGRRFLDRSADTYDVVVIDPPPPIEAAGSSLLYSREFYQAIRPHLAAGGIVQAWIPGVEPSVGAAMLLALRDVFPYVRVFSSVERWGLHLLASAAPIPARTGAELAARMPPDARADLVAWGPFATPEEQLQAVVGHEAAIDWTGMRAVALPLTDDRPLNEYFFVRRVLR